MLVLRQTTPSRARPQGSQPMRARLFAWRGNSTVNRGDRIAPTATRRRTRMTIKKPADSQRFSRILTVALSLIAITLSLAVSGRAQSEATLHSFANDADGYNPVANLVIDEVGNLYSTTSEGGSFTGCRTGGVVLFE